MDDVAKAFLILGLVLIFGGVFGALIYRIALKYLKRRPTLAGTLFSAFFSAVVTLVVTYQVVQLQKQAFANRIDHCFFKIENAENADLVSVLIEQPNEVRQDLCSHTAEDPKNQYRCLKLQKTFRLHDSSSGDLDGAPCETLSE